MKNFLYFQPEYVARFKCDGSKCNARCCKGWKIDIDAEAYKKYSQLELREVAEKIISHMKFDSERGEYVVTLDEKNFCPFLTAEIYADFSLTTARNFYRRRAQLIRATLASWENFLSGR